MEGVDTELGLQPCAVVVVVVGVVDLEDKHRQHRAVLLGMHSEVMVVVEHPIGHSERVEGHRVLEERHKHSLGQEEHRRAEGDEVGHCRRVNLGDKVEVDSDKAGEVEVVLVVAHLDGDNDKERARYSPPAGLGPPV